MKKISLITVTVDEIHYSYPTVKKTRDGSTVLYEKSRTITVRLMGIPIFRCTHALNNLREEPFAD